MFTNVRWYMLPFVWFVVAPLMYYDYASCRIKFKYREMKRKYKL